MINWKWLVTMSFRDFRHNKGKLLLFISSIIAGIGALVAIQSFSDNLLKDINRQAKELIGADLVLSSNQVLPKLELDTISIKMASECNFGSMVINEINGESRLTQVRAMQGEFPFYGNILTSPESAINAFQNGQPNVLVERLLLLQLDTNIGDSLKIGNQAFRITGVLESIPGQSGIVSSVAPAALIPMAYLDSTGLVQYGSRVQYSQYYQLPISINPDKIIEKNQSDWEDQNIRYESVELRKASTGRAFSNLGNFLSLVAFIALLLGSIGVASSINVYIKEKIGQIGVLRCMGCTTNEAFGIYLFQVIVIAFIGSTIGALIGSLLQFVLPYILQDFLPVVVHLSVSWKSIVFGIITGIIVSILFALIPLTKIRMVSPMVTLRPVEMERLITFKRNWWVYGLIVLFIAGFSVIIAPTIKIGLGFTLFILISFGILWGLSRGIMWALKKSIRPSIPYIFRQSLANLFRPNNQTTSLIATIGLGTSLIGTLFFLQDQLISQVKMADRAEQPNMLLFDIQDHQIDSIAVLLKRQSLPILQRVPIVTMKMEKVNGIDRKMNDSLPEALKISKGLYQREYRNTYRDTLLPSESLVRGKLKPFNNIGDSIFISVESDYARRTGLKIGDEMQFNVQGRQIKTYIGSLRDIKVNQISTIFLFVFPEGVLNKAPKFHVLITKTPSDQITASLQREVLRSYPNVSAINLNNIVDTLENILGKVGFVIKFMAFFSIITGFLVLISALMISKDQRLKESVLLRTLGASNSQVNYINLMEYFLLGSIATLSGLLISVIATIIFSQSIFEITVQIPWIYFIAIFLFISGAIVSLSVWNGRGFKNTSTIEILR
jgi:putative ABC transport system permease protein